MFYKKNYNFKSHDFTIIARITTEDSSKWKISIFENSEDSDYRSTIETDVDFIKTIVKELEMSARNYVSRLDKADSIFSSLNFSKKH